MSECYVYGILGVAAPFILYKTGKCQMCPFIIIDRRQSLTSVECSFRSRAHIVCDICPCCTAMCVDNAYRLEVLVSGMQN
jgi:hypothetical protein